MFISDLLSQYREYLQHERKLAQQTITAYNNDLKLLAKAVDKPLLEITKSDLRAYMRQMSKEGLATATIRRKFHGFRTFWTWLKLAEIDDRMIPEQIDLPKRTRPAPNWLTESELRTFVETLDGNPRNDLAWAVLAYLGVRRGELLNLRWSDIDIESKTVTIQPGKNKRARILHIPDGLLVRILKLQSTFKTLPEFVFNGSHGRWGVQPFNRAFKRHLVRCGLDDHGITPHSLRHSFATHLIRRGVNISDVKELLGHKDISTTSIYIHHDPDGLKKALERHILN